MTWNYRIFKRDTPHSAEGEHLYYIAECYYKDDDQVEPELRGTLDDHNYLYGDTEEDLKKAYDTMREAFNAPVIELDEKGDFKEKT